MILSIDLGSTSFKVAVVDAKLNVRGLGSHPVKHRFAAGGKVELDAGVATSALQKAIRAAIASAGIRAAALRAVAFTSQAQTFTILDKNGKARMPFISWQDNRAVETCEKLKRNRALAHFDQHCSFGVLLAALHFCQLKHIQDTRKGFIGTDNRIVHLPTYFVHRMTGVAAIDENIAAMTGLYSLALRDWWPVALRICGLSQRQLPELRPIGGVAALTNAGAAEFGLPCGIPVVLAGNDQTSGAYAASLDENHGVLVTLGTAYVAYAYAAKMPKPDPALIRGPFPHGGFYRMAADGNGGNVINWAQTVLAGCGTAERFFQLAGQAQPGCQGLVFDASCDTGKGAWSHIGLHHTPADFARSVVESLARRIATMVSDLGVRADKTRVLVAGGGSKSPVWVRILSETLGARIKVAQGHPHIGAARMALKHTTHSRS